MMYLPQSRNLLHFASHVTTLAQKRKETKRTGTIRNYMGNRRRNNLNLNYVVLIWTPFLSNRQYRVLQTTPYNALPQDEVSRILSVKKHNQLLDKQYLIACCPPIPTNSLPYQQRHQNLQLEHHTFHTYNSGPPVSEIQHSAHQTTVTTAMDELSHNWFSNQHPLPILDNGTEVAVV